MNINQVEVPDIIEQRYYIDKVLGHGGMAVVYKVCDRFTGRELALKRLAPRGDQNRKDKCTNLFEREYHTLANLSHSRIVEVYDYGIEEGVPYYTMELLNGGDLRELSPMSWRQACKLLIDVCYALSFLHSRRLVHRDLSPRNVRCTNNGIAKLIDFGAMIPMGPGRQVVGTAPFVAPEVLNYQSLDGRADLYSMGTTLYYILTGRLPYSARDFKTLREKWRIKPALPSEYIKDIPRSLDDLVMSLIHLDFLVRPDNAAEVIERLSAIAEIDLDPQFQAFQAYLSTPTLVGRQSALQQIRKMLVRAQLGHGGSLIVKGVAGVGRSRFLDACVLEGKLLGAMVIRCDASDAKSGDYGVICAMIGQLLEMMQESSEDKLKERVAILGHVYPDLQQRCKGMELKRFKDPYKLRPAIQDQLRDWMFDVSRKRTLLITIDDVHRIDEPSAAFIALLAQDITGYPLVMAISAESEAIFSAEGAMKFLNMSGSCIELENLCAEDTRNLLSSVFGQVPNIQLITHRLQEISKGNPRDVLQLAQHLVDTKLACYHSGAWTLPDKIDVGDLPNSIAQTLKRRVDSLSREAKLLAITMALSSGQGYTFRDCLVLTENAETNRLLRSLDELVAADIVRVDGELYSISHLGWESALKIDDQPDSTKELHLRLARMYQEHDNQSFRIAQHLIAAGEIECGLDILVDYSEKSKEITDQNSGAYVHLLQSLPSDWFETYLIAVALCKKLNRPRRQIYLLQSRISGAAALTNISDTDYLTEMIESFYQDCGLDIYYKLDANMDPTTCLSLALEKAQKRYQQTPESKRIYDPITSIRHLARAIIETCGALVTSYNFDLWKKIPSLEPLISLSPALEVVEMLVKAVGNRLVGRNQLACHHYRKILERTSHPDRAGLDETYHKNICLGVMRAEGTLQAVMGNQAALQLACQIEKEPLYDVNALQIRLLYYLWQGESEQAKNCRQAMELLRIQKNPTLLYAGANLSHEFSAFALIDDLVGVKLLLDPIKGMSQKHKTWIPTYYYAMGEYHRIRGDYTSAYLELSKSIKLILPGEYYNWAEIQGAFLRTLLELGRFRDVRTQACIALQSAENSSLGYQCNFIRMPLALAEAKLGDFNSAICRSQAVIDELNQMGSSGILLGLAYETRARIAITMRESNDYQRFTRLCFEQFCRKANSTLNKKYESLLRDARNPMSLAPSDFVFGADFFNKDERSIAHRVNLILKSCKSKEVRFKAILDMLIAYSKTNGGCLYTMQENGPSLSAQSDFYPIIDNLDSIVRDYLMVELEEMDDVTLTGIDEIPLNHTASCYKGTSDSQYHFLLIGHHSQGDYIITGLAVLLVDPDRSFIFPIDMVSKVSRLLIKSGDVTRYIVQSYS